MNMERKTLSFDSGTLIVGVDLHLGQLVQAIEERGVPENGLPFDEHYQLCIKTPEFINSEPEGFSIWPVGRGIIASVCLFRQPKPDVIVPRYSLTEGITLVSEVAYGIVDGYVDKSEWDAYVAKHCRITYDGEDGMNDTLAQCEEDWDRYNRALDFAYRLTKRRVLNGLRVEQRYCVTKEIDGMVPAGAIARIQSISVANYDESGEPAPIQIHFSHLINQPNGETKGSFWFSEAKAKEICTLQVLD